jgi:phosphatidylserine decarboxylase
LASVRSSMLVKWYAERFEVDVAEAEHPLEAYGSILEFFTRKLKPGLRPIDPSQDGFASPVDGRLSASGTLNDATLIQAKGRTYALSALLADEEQAKRFRAGGYATIYLSPKDYHRIHAPVSGKIVEIAHVPGRLYPVNDAAVANVDSLFARNERLIVHIESEAWGRVAVIAVGAIGVGYIRSTHAPDLPQHPSRLIRKCFEYPQPVQKGDELAIFDLGSTVVVLTERPWQALPHPPISVTMGARLGSVAGQISPGLQSKTSPAGVAPT